MSHPGAPETDISIVSTFQRLSAFPLLRVPRTETLVKPIFSFSPLCCLQLRPPPGSGWRSGSRAFSRSRALTFWCGNLIEQRANLAAFVGCGPPAPWDLRLLPASRLQAPSVSLTSQPLCGGVFSPWQACPRAAHSGRPPSGSGRLSPSPARLWGVGCANHRSFGLVFSPLNLPRQESGTSLCGPDAGTGAG